MQDKTVDRHHFRRRDKAQLEHLKIKASVFKALPEYSATRPTGTTPGKMWKRLNGIFDTQYIREGYKPYWMIQQYKEVPGKPDLIATHSYFPIIILGR